MEDKNKKDSAKPLKDITFETVYKIPDSVLKGEKGAKFLRKEDLEGLTEHSLLYFLRRSNYHILHDYPCMGAWERRLRYSEIKGPYEISPETERQSESWESEDEVLELLIQKDLMPVIFEDISLAEYGTQADPNSLRHLRIVAGEKIEPEKIMGIGKNILGHLSSKGNLKKISDSNYRAVIDNCLLEFTMAPTYFYPLVEMRIFGKGEVPQQLIREFRLYELEEQFPDWDRDVGIRDSVRRGVAYNLPYLTHCINLISIRDSARKGVAYNLTLNGNLKEISKLIKRENVVL